MRNRLTALTLLTLTAACSTAAPPSVRGVETIEKSAVDVRGSSAPDVVGASPEGERLVAPAAPMAAEPAPREEAKRSEDMPSGATRADGFSSGARPRVAASPAKRAVGRPSMDDDESRPRGGAVVARSEASVRAGEWDDNANYREFKRFLANEAHLAFEKLDLSSRRFLVVRDVDGKGIPNCRVAVEDQHQHQAELTTTASGRALLFPRAHGLEGASLTAKASCLGRQASARFDATTEDGVVDLRLDTARAELARTIDLVFVLDTTGSMSEEIHAVKDTLRKVARDASKLQTTIRVGLVEYRDRGDAFVTRVYPFSTDLNEFSRRIESLQAGGGGDTPEHFNEGLRVALSELAWNDGASARLAFLIADAPPHLDYAGDNGYTHSLQRAAARGVQLYTVAASGMDDLGQVVFRQAAQFTGATNMFVLRGGAGPQSTGGGDPKSSCGGTQSNYTSANLDQLIFGKLELTERLLELDPMRIAGVGRDETAKPCAERLVLAR